MANEENPTTLRPIFRVQDQSSSEHAPTQKRSRNRSLVARVSGQDWAVPALLLLLDVVGWLVIYGFTSLLRGDAYYSSPFLFFVIDMLQASVIVLSLITIGGYDPNTETRGLAYTAEHILAIAAAGVISSVLIYAAASFDATMKPSRGVLLLSFIIFLPVSLEYRRWLRGRVTARVSNLAYLVIGSGEMAQRFYEEYRNSPNRQRLEFVDVDPARTGRPIAGAGSPMVEGNIETKLERLYGNYSGVILAEHVDRIPTALVERLVRTQFQRARVYTIESFYESHWRYVPLEAIDPVWPLQTGFQLARISPYHYLKRLCDVSAALIGIIFFFPVFALCALLVWLESGRPVAFYQTRVGRGGSEFTLYKLRTMKIWKAGDFDDIYTRRNDPRITRVGRFLRKYRLDELPQLWNVFKGEMSLIGPPGGVDEVRRTV